MHKYKELKFWQKSIDLVTTVYSLTRNFPDVEKFRLVSQINRSAVSIPSKIVEGAGRNSDKEFVQFLAFAQVSSYELETQLIRSNNLNHITIDQLTELQKMNFAIQSKIKQKA